MVLGDKCLFSIKLFAGPAGLDSTLRVIISVNLFAVFCSDARCIFTVQDGEENGCRGSPCRLFGPKHNVVRYDCGKFFQLLDLFTLAQCVLNTGGQLQCSHYIVSFHLTFAKRLGQVKQTKVVPAVVSLSTLSLVKSVCFHQPFVDCLEHSQFESYWSSHE